MPRAMRTQIQKDRLRTGMRAVLSTGEDCLVLENVECENTMQRWVLINLTTGKPKKYDDFNDDLIVPGYPEWTVSELWVSAVAMPYVDGTTLAPLQQARLHLLWSRHREEL